MPHHGPYRQLIGSAPVFPFPAPDPRTVVPELEALGERLYTARATYMVDTQQGLTEAYNQLKDPGCDDGRVVALRRLHEELDRAVLEAYGWRDVEVPAYCGVGEEEMESSEMIPRTHAGPRRRTG